MGFPDDLASLSFRHQRQKEDQVPIRQLTPSIAGCLWVCEGKAPIRHRELSFTLINQYESFPFSPFGDGNKLRWRREHLTLSNQKGLISEKIDLGWSFGGNKTIIHVLRLKCAGHSLLLAASKNVLFLHLNTHTHTLP